jgi:hypothetical protein
MEEKTSEEKSSEVKFNAILQSNPCQLFSGLDRKLFNN